jgi:hypothetical protein
MSDRKPLNGAARAAIAAGTDVYSVQEFHYGWRVTKNGNLIGDSRAFDKRADAELDAQTCVALDPETRLFMSNIH